MKKTVWIIVIILFLICMLNACMTSTQAQWRIREQPNTKWVSEDETIVFYVDDNRQTTGTMCVNEKNIDIYLREGLQRDGSMYIYPIEVLQEEIWSESRRYECWQCAYKSEDKFVATVEETAFFEVGQKITFHRVDEILETSTCNDITVGATISRPRADNIRPYIRRM